MARQVQPRRAARLGSRSRQRRDGRARGGLAVALLNFPLLALWDHDVLWLGLPFFPAALFAIWALLIGLLAWVVERPAAGVSGSN